MSIKKTELELIINSFSPPSSPLFALPQLPLPLASSPSLFPLPCHASILTESVSLWLSHPALPLKLPLALHLFLFACSSIYLSISVYSIYTGLLFFFILLVVVVVGGCCLVLWCLIACYYFTFLFSPLLTPSFCCPPCLSASCYCNHLFTQPVVHFLPSPVSYSLILSDFITLTQEKALLFSLPTTATNSDRVFLFVAQLWRVHAHACICVHISLHYIKKKKTLCYSICHAFLSLIYTHKYSLATGCKHHKCTVNTQRP